MIDLCAGTDFYCTTDPLCVSVNSILIDCGVNKEKQRHLGGGLDYTLMATPPLLQFLGLHRATFPIYMTRLLTW